MAAAKRMSPTGQGNARADLEQQLANVMTGDPGIDSLNAAMVRRNFLFGIPGQQPALGQAAAPPTAAPAAGPVNPIAQLMAFIRAHLMAQGAK